MMNNVALAIGYVVIITVFVTITFVIVMEILEGVLNFIQSCWYHSKEAIKCLLKKK